MPRAPRTPLSSQGTKLAIVKEQLAHMLAGMAIFIGLFLVDLVLFVAYIAKSSIELVKEIFR